ncbi:hypothetical protein GCM10010124_25610 [Pilimelia terevasa]|uniref:Uncharacterized protein n=2 Tax=Pilimelia terevasa TaxID=53372 RepID=A0A8J3FJ02_9ACTN|nr:hypothetical protein GCM10010124_25610 [Pilimelia terevasa]
MLESRPETTPRDWLEAAGWKRLTALNRALGELAHTKATSRWSGARELLAKFQQDINEEDAIYTARGAALDFVAELLARELAAEVSEISPTISEGLLRLFLEIGLCSEQHSYSLESRFNHIWSHRTTSLGDSDFILLPDLWPQQTL